MIPADIIQTDFPKVSPICLVEEAARIMRDHGLHALPVVERDRLNGVIACEDIVYRGIADGIDWFFAHVEDFMTAEPKAAFASSSVIETKALLDAERLDWLPVLDENRKYVGVIRLQSLETLDTAPQSALA